MKLIFQSLKPYKIVSILAPLFKMLEALLDLFVPLVTADMINVGVETHNTAYILQRCGVLLLLGILGLAASITAQFFSAKAAVGAASDLRSRLYAHVLSLGSTETDRLGAGTLIVRMTSDVQQVQDGLNMALRLLLRSPFIVVGAAIFACKVDLHAGALTAGAIPVLSVIVFAVMGITAPKYVRVQEKLDRLTTQVRESLTGVRVIRAFHTEQIETDRFRMQNNELLTGQLRVGRISAWLNPMTLVVVNLFTAAILYTGAIRVGTGALRQGDVIALVNYMSQILIELVKLVNTIVLLTKSVASAKRLQELMDMQPAMSFGEELPDVSAQTAVEFSDVMLQYEGASEPSLSGISFRVERGETVGVIGGTGSGKSSLVNLIPRFYDTTEGSVRVFGKDVRALSKSYLRQRIGVVPQKAQLFAGTVQSNLTFGTGQDVCEVTLWQALETAQAAEFVREMPQGLQSSVEQGGRNFSGGQRQRLTIARALVIRPDILILDDSASALDLATDAALRKALRQVSVTTLIVSQRISGIRQADRILVLDDGKLVGCGTHDELLTSCGVYRDIYESQRGETEADV